MTDDRHDGAVMITGEENVRMASLLALRGALSLEVRGMRRRGRSAQTIANEVMGTDYRNKRATYRALDKFIVSKGGPARPLNF